MSEPQTIPCIICNVPTSGGAFASDICGTCWNGAGVKYITAILRLKALAAPPSAPSAETAREIARRYPIILDERTDNLVREIAAALDAARSPTPSASAEETARGIAGECDGPCLCDPGWADCCRAARDASKIAAALDAARAEGIEAAAKAVAAAGPEMCTHNEEYQQRIRALSPEVKRAE